MKLRINLFKRTLLMVVLLLYSFGMAADYFGDNRKAQPIRYQVQDNKIVKVRDAPGLSGKKTYTLKGADIIYVDDTLKVYNDHYYWLAISGKRGYVASNYLTAIPNPHYERPVEQSAAVVPMSLGKAHRVTKWILLALMVLALTWLIIGFEYPKRVANFLGVYQANGMRRLFFYNVQPYQVVLEFCCYLLLSAVAALLLLLAVGAVVYGLFWLIKWLLVVLVYAAIVGTVISGLALWAGVKDLGCGGLVICGGIWAAGDPIKRFGEMLVDAGLSFFKELNMLNFAKELVTNYWAEGIAFASIPIVLFLSLAAFALLLSGLFMLLEWSVTSYYNIKHPCPICHQKSEPALYLGSDGEELPVRLRPGMYGLFSITNPSTGEKMPTMIFNGRDRLARRCPQCHNIIRAKTGQEKHVALVGLPRSGKTTLICRMISHMLHGLNSKVEFTDKVDTTTRNYIDSISDQQELAGNFPGKTGEGRHRSIQLTVHTSGLSMPYHLFLNDVAGEQFTSASSKTEHAPFFAEVQSVLFLIDPYTTYFGNLEVSDSFATWYQTQVGGDIKEKGDKLDLSEALDVLKNLLEGQHNPTHRVHFNFLLVKKDTGYLEGINAYDPEAIKQFLVEQLNLANLVYNVEQGYKDVHFMAVSAADELAHSNVPELLKLLFTQLGIKG